ncbi:MAG: 2-oxo acid dehydrogenase subunit E2 [Puniceicoccaceae bacterium]|nr:MAG: 2-oxo acid dehydrogenase subunit E2 [Puniceicoccaceae bacterium]
MATIIEMPKLSDTMTVGTLVNWLKKEGDKVSSGDMIAEVETDKATMELEAFDEGILLKQFVKAGEQVEVGTPIAAVGEKGEKVEKPDSGGTKDKKEDDGEDEKADDKKAEKENQAAGKGAEEKDDTADRKEEKADDSGEADDSTDEDEETEETPAPSRREKGGRIKASPLARRLAEKKGIDLASVQGTGPGGRIVKADVLKAAEAGPPKAPKSGSAPGKTPSAPPAPAGAPIAEDRDVKVSNMRAVIARRLLESKTQVPHFYVEVECDAAPIAALRESVNAGLAEVPPEKGGLKFTLNDFILKAAAEALRRVPAVNVAWQGETVRHSGAVHLAFGVAVEEGLLTPVIRNAHAKTLRQIALEARDLIAKARSKKLKPEEMSGSTFTVTNLGMFGVARFYGIINPPNAGILSVAGILDRPVVRDGAIVPGKLMTIGLSGDHRAIDGAVAAQFLAELKTLVESPALFLV